MLSITSKKSCFGNYMIDGCKTKYGCSESLCTAVTNAIHGACDCRYKPSCHLGRQELQVKFGNDPASCDFTRLLRNNRKTYVEGCPLCNSPILYDEFLRRYSCKCGYEGLVIIALKTCAHCLYEKFCDVDIKERPDGISSVYCSSFSNKMY